MGLFWRRERGADYISHNFLWTASAYRLLINTGVLLKKKSRLDLFEACFLTRESRYSDVSQQLLRTRSVCSVQLLG